jgi:DNA repair photolyase
MVAPVIPQLNDRDLEAILAAAADAGAREAGYILLRLPLEVEALFRDWMEAHYPLRAGHVMTLMRQLHGGRAYDSAFGVRQRGTGNFAELLAQRFAIASRRLGLDRSRAPLDASRFAPPRPESPQLELF